MFCMLDWFVITVAETEAVSYVLVLYCCAQGVENAAVAAKAANVERLVLVSSALVTPRNRWCACPPLKVVATIDAQLQHHAEAYSWTTSIGTPSG